MKSRLSAVLRLAFPLAAFIAGVFCSCNGDVKTANGNEAPPASAAAPGVAPGNASSIGKPEAERLQSNTSESALPVYEFSDSMSISEGRKAGQSMAGSRLEKGNGSWIVDGQVCLRADGSASSAKEAGGSAFHAIPRSAGLYKLSADVCSKGSACSAIALFSENPAGRFFQAVGISMTINNGSYEIAAKGMGKIKSGTKADFGNFVEDGPTRLELDYDSMNEVLSARINGHAVLDKVKLESGAAGPPFAYAGFCLAGPIKPEIPYVRNYSATVKPLASSGFKPADLSELFVDPEKNFSIRLNCESLVEGRPASFIISDYQDKDVLRGSAEAGGKGAILVKARLPRGFFKLTFPSSKESFGIVSLEKAGRIDPFFCMDAAISALELNPERREALARILSRCGIAMARERLNGVANIDHAKGKYDWDGGKYAFDSMRGTYARCKVPILEMLDAGARPGDLPGAAKALAEIARHWDGNWGGAEVCNEPDLGNSPADRYAIVAKCASYALAEAKSETPLATGVFATIPPGPFFDAFAANGIFEDANAISFHSYDKAPDIEGIVSRYREWMGKAGFESMPLWHSECGWPWSNGPARPPTGQDAKSALEISAKAAESMACGVARHFPFVYVYYEEGHKNFGMMGREASPLRSMAAYAMCARTLAGRQYIGDIQGLDSAVKLARVFKDLRSDECVAVLYTGEIDPEAAAALPFNAERALGIDGRLLPLAGGKAPIPDGMSYVFANIRSLGAALKTGTKAAKLYQIGLHPMEKVRKASPIVLEFLSKETPSRASARRYLVTQAIAQSLPIKIRIHNLSQECVEVSPELCLPGGSPEKAGARMIQPMGFSDIAWKLDASKCLDIASTRFITASASVDRGIQPSPLAIPMAMEGTLEQHLARHSSKKGIPIDDLQRWSENIAKHGKSKFSAGPDGWKMDVSFSGSNDNWAYPKFALPFNIDPAEDSGFLIRARILKPAGTVAIMANPNQLEGFWASDLFPADGEWHVVYAPFSELKPGPGHAGMQNTRLNPALWKVLAIGMGSQAKENSLELSHFIIVGGSGAE